MPPAVSEQILRLSMVVLASAHEQFVPMFRLSSPEVIRLVVMMYGAIPAVAAQRRGFVGGRAGSTSATRPSRFWWYWFGPMFAAEILKEAGRALCAAIPQWRVAFGRGVVGRSTACFCYLWRAVDHEGVPSEAVVTARRDKAAALKLLKRIMKNYGAPRSIVTDGLRAYSAAMNEIGVAADRPTRLALASTIAQRIRMSRFGDVKRAMQRFRSLKTLQKFSSVHAQVPLTNSIKSAISLRGKSPIKQRRSAAC